jgi:hypothetical protein
MTFIWWSALSLVLDGFAGHAAGIYPAAPQNTAHQADAAPNDAMPSEQ